MFYSPNSCILGRIHPNLQQNNIALFSLQVYYRNYSKIIFIDATFDFLKLANASLIRSIPFGDKEINCPFKSSACDYPANTIK